jgi:subtilisin family serine protease/uncharacterized protein YkwD
MRHRQRTSGLALGVALLALVIGAAASTPGAAAAVCVIIDPVLAVGCEGSAPRQAQEAPIGEAQSGGAESEPSPQQTSTVPRYDPRHLTVTFDRGTSRQKIDRVLADAGVTLELAIPKIRAYLVGVDPDRRAAALDSLTRSRSVDGAEQEILAEALDTTPNDTDWPRQTGIRRAGFPKAWDITQGSSSVIVAVLDTGVDAAQADLRGALVPGYDFVNSDAAPSDDHGHGTAVAGIIGARADNAQGLAGICWLCSVMPVKVLDSKGEGPETAVAAGIVWAADHGAQVINLSLGGPAATQQLTDAVAYATRKGAVLVAAAGNTGTSVPFYPAADLGAIGVAATTADDRPYPWSNFGLWVDVAASGCNIAPLLSGGYGSFCGTSSAAPVVAGLAALALSARPNADAAEIEQALERPAVPLPGVVRFGRIDAPGTLALIGAAERPRLRSVFKGVLSQQRRTRTHAIRVGGGRLTAKLVFAKGRRMSLSLAAERGDAPLARVAGLSPLRIERTLQAGTAVLAVRGAARTSYVLTLSYPGEGPRRLSGVGPDRRGPGEGAQPLRRILLSRIPRLEHPHVPGSRAQLGAPRASGPPHASVLEVALKNEAAIAVPILRQINAVRASHGLSQLRPSASLSAAAAAHAKALLGTGQFTHSWANGSPFATWILRYYPARSFRSWSAGENLVWASPGLTPESAVTAWLQSATHRRVLLTPEWRELGIAVVSAQRAPGVFAGYDVSLAAAEFGARIR